MLSSIVIVSWPLPLLESKLVMVSLPGARVENEIVAADAGAGELVGNAGG
jgi:hypothetical protein